MFSCFCFDLDFVLLEELLAVDETGQDLNPGPLQDQDAVLRLMSLCL